MGLALGPPTDWLTRSAKLTVLALKPTVLMLARLLPMTLSFCWLALSPDRLAKTILLTLESSFGGRCDTGSEFRDAAKRSDVFLDVLKTLERAELSQLREELAVGLGLHRILMLQLGHEQRQKGLAAKCIRLDRAGLVPSFRRAPKSLQPPLSLLPAQWGHGESQSRELVDVAPFFAPFGRAMSRERSLPHPIERKMPLARELPGSPGRLDEVGAPSHFNAKLVDRRL
jgi:hypothetical protein